jgi:hypothetical protein
VLLPQPAPVLGGGLMALAARARTSGGGGWRLG